MCKEFVFTLSVSSVCVCHLSHGKSYLYLAVYSAYIYFDSWPMCVMVLPCVTAVASTGAPILAC